MKILFVIAIIVLILLVLGCIYIEVAYRWLVKEDKKLMDELCSNL